MLAWFRNHCSGPWGPPILNGALAKSMTHFARALELEQYEYMCI